MLQPLRQLRADDRGAESTEYIVIGMIIVGIILLVFVTFVNRVQTASANTTTTLNNCVPSAAQSGNFTGCQ